VKKKAGAFPLCPLCIPLCIMVDSAFDLQPGLRHGAGQGGVANAEAALLGGIEGGLTYFSIHTVNNGGSEIRVELTAVPRPRRGCRTAVKRFSSAFMARQRPSASVFM
jgi:hypothetical protein